MLYPIRAISGIDCYTLHDYVEENRRFIEKMGALYINDFYKTFWGLNGNMYLTVEKMQEADEEFIFRQNNGKLTP